MLFQAVLVMYHMKYGEAARHTRAVGMQLSHQGIGLGEHGIPNGTNLLCIVGAPGPSMVPLGSSLLQLECRLQTQSLAQPCHIQHAGGNDRQCPWTLPRWAYSRLRQRYAERLAEMQESIHMHAHTVRKIGLVMDRTLSHCRHREQHPVGPLWV